MPPLVLLVAILPNDDCDNPPPFSPLSATDVKIWSVMDGKCISTVDSNQLQNTMALLSPDGRFLAVAAFTADVKVSIFYLRSNQYINDASQSKDK